MASSTPAPGNTAAKDRRPSSSSKPLSGSANFGAHEFVPDTDFEVQCTEALDHVHQVVSQRRTSYVPTPPSRGSARGAKSAGNKTGNLPMIPHTTRKALFDRAAAPPVKPTLRGSSANRSHFESQQSSGAKDKVKDEFLNLSTIAPPSSTGGVTEPELCSFMDQTRRVGGEFSTSLIAKMVTAALSASANAATNATLATPAVTGNDVARCVQAGLPFAADWGLLVAFLLKHKDAQDGIVVTKKGTEKFRPTPSVTLAERAVIGRPIYKKKNKSSIVTAGTFASSASPSPARQQPQQLPQVLMEEKKRNLLLDYIPFKEAKHPTWSVHYEPPASPDDDEKGGSMSGDALGTTLGSSFTATLRSNASREAGNFGGTNNSTKRKLLLPSGSPRSQGTLTLSKSATSNLQRLMELQFIDDNSVVCCKAGARGTARQFTPAEHMEALVTHPAGVRAVIVDLNTVMKAKGDHFNPTHGCQGLSEGANLPDCWSPPLSKPSKKPPPKRTQQQINCINSIVSYIER